MDRGAWWAAVYGVAQSQTRLTRLSSSSSIDKVTLSRDLEDWREEPRCRKELPKHVLGVLKNKTHQGM